MPAGAASVAAKAPMFTDDDFKRLLQQFDRPWSGYRKIRKGVKKRIRRHMQNLGCRQADAYLGMVRQDPLAKAACDQLLLVIIGRFFRDKNLRGIWNCAFCRAWRTGFPELTPAAL